jgi:pimeloyl-ACP methyl ester carboxylesterase
MTCRAVTSCDGTRIGWVSYGRGDPVLLVHGGGADHTRLEPFASLLSDRFSVHVVDRRGRSLSGDGHGYRIEMEYDDIAVVAEALGDNVTVVGHSYGGAVAIGAATRTQAIGRVVAYEGWPAVDGSPPSYDPGNLPERVQALVDSGDRDGAVRAVFSELVGVEDEQLAWMRAQPMWTSRMAAAHTLPREIRQEPTTTLSEAAFRYIPAAVLFVIGGLNEASFRPQAERLCSIMPDGRVAVLSGQGHLAMDTAPVLLAQTIIDFVDTSLRPRMARLTTRGQLADGCE